MQARVATRVALTLAIGFASAACKKVGRPIVADPVPASAPTGVAGVPAGATPGSPGSPAAPVTPGTEAELRALMVGWQSAPNMEAAMRAMRPKPEDYADLFQGKTADAVRAFEDKAIWNGTDFPPRPPAGVQVSLTAATTAQLQAGGTDASAAFFGWKGIAGQLQPGLTFYSMEMSTADAKPGKEPSYDIGFDGIVYLNGRWVAVPSPWQATDKP
jgi:hypothetical protein